MSASLLLCTPTGLCAILVFGLPSTAAVICLLTLVGMPFPFASGCWNIATRDSAVAAPLLEETLGFSCGFHEEWLSRPMIYQFGLHELDLARAELRADGTAVPLEPLPFALLCLLVENHDRMVSKDEIVEVIWDGRIISDAALATSIKAIRHALNDDGKTQGLLRTVRGRGFRFVGDVKLTVPAVAAETPPDARASDVEKSDPSIGKPVVAVMPFQRLGDREGFEALGDAVPAEIISSLSRLRWLNVIARGSSFRFRNPDLDLPQIGRALSATYFLSGIIELRGADITIEVDLGDARENRVIWSDRYSCKIDDVHAVRTEVIAGVIQAMELYVPLNEAQSARLRSTDKLDAWGAYHLGLQHMYRFTKSDNRIAARYFEQSTALDPLFARAHAGLSFTSFQDSFLKYSVDPLASALDARRQAERSLELDPVDSMGNFVFGRALWLDRDPDAGLPWLERATGMNPNYAQGFYARAWADIMADRSASGRQNIDRAISLSPIDPLLYAMLATRSVTHVLNGEYQDAADWAERAASAPGSHFLVGAIAVAAHDLAGQHSDAVRWAANVKRRRPDASTEHFFKAFPFRKPATESRLRSSLEKYGF